jgi:hypothetical protein
VDQRLGRGTWSVAALACAAVLACWLCSTPAHAVPGHSFDATLSLEGNCKGKDGVADPGCPGGLHPPETFDNPCGTAVDRHGYIYVASSALADVSGKGGRIDVFNAQGEFLTEIKDEHQPCSLAVDSEGNLYVAEYQGKNAVAFEPESYPPTAGTKYTSTVVFESTELGCYAWSTAVDPSNDHLYVGLGCMIVEYGSAAEGWPLLRENLVGDPPLSTVAAVDVSGQSHDLYVTSAVPGTPREKAENARLYVLDGTDGKVECEAAGFSFNSGNAGVGVDQANGDVYVDDMINNATRQFTVRQFDSACMEIGQLPSVPFLEQPQPFADVAVDDPCLVGEALCNPSAPYDSPNEGYVFVGSGVQASKSHLYAYAPKLEGPPIVKEQAVSDVSESEATLQASINPQGAETTYHFEYVTQAQFDEDEYAQAASTPSEEAGASASPVVVSTPVAGLQPGTTYRFRAVASNCASREVETDCLTVGEGEGGVGPDASFSTYPSVPPQSCINESLRTGPSAELPDCRAYELVTPPQTNGRIPTMTALGAVSDDGFATDLASADGTSLIFGVEGGTLPGSEGSGFHDTYRAQRGPTGWQSQFNGLPGDQASEVFVGGVSPDHRYASFFVNDLGAHTLAKGNYLRGSDGAIELVGLGSLGSDPEAAAKLITANGAHVIFTSTAHLEAAATENLPPPAAQTATIYDRAVGGSTQVVSLLPGEVTPAPGSNVAFQGTSPDASTVAFKVGGTLYLRRAGATQEVTAEPAAFGGLSQDGSVLTYLRPGGPPPKGNDPPHGDIFSYDASSDSAVQVSSGGEAILVNVSADGSHVFYVSPNPGPGGLYDLFAWDTTAQVPSLIATVTERDVLGQPTDVLATMTDGLGLWVNAVQSPGRNRADGPGADPSRTTADGSVILFESRAELTPYENAGKSEIYRYSQEDGLSCISCNPTGQPGLSDAQLQAPFAKFLVSLPPLSDLANTANLTPDGQAAFFETADPLIADDNDGKVDVYEWKAEGKEGCELPAGCLALISSGHSATDDYLYAVSADGHDVFLETADPLLPSDPDGGYSIYDARVGGGFAQTPPPAEPCQGTDACRAPSPPPSLPSTASGPFAGQNASPTKGRHCPKGKHRTRRAGKTRCVKKGRHGAKSKGRRAR